MHVQVILVPYDSGHRDVRMGRGPAHLMQGGAEGMLQAAGHTARCERIEAEGRFPAEIATTFELLGLVAQRVRAARSQAAFPLILSGNCNSAVGAIAGLEPAGLGLIWLDAHGEFNTPETTTSGFLDGMGLAMAAGRCWRAIAATIPGFRPLPEANIVLVGVRDMDPEEEALLAGSRIAVVGARQISELGVRAALGPALASLAGRVQRVYLHIDLDVLDPAKSQANEFAAPGGPAVSQVGEAIAFASERLAICAAGIASYDPAIDNDDRALRAGLALMQAIVAAGERGCRVEWHR